MLGVDDKKRARSTYPLLSVEGVKISYKANGRSNVAVGDVSFEVYPGEKVMLLGPSGCGKSTLLKAIAGFIEPDGGGISFAGRRDLRPGPDRAVVFQEFDQLFPWRTVLDNVAYPLRVTVRGGEEALASAGRYLEMISRGHGRGNVQLPATASGASRRNRGTEVVRHAGWPLAWVLLPASLQPFY